jgi:hypothetical protein
MISKLGVQQKKANSWHYAVLGALLGLLIVLLSFKKFYCFYAYQEQASTVTGGLVILATIAGLIAKFIGDKEKISFNNVHGVFFLVCGLFVSAGVVISFSPLFYQLDKNGCVERFDELVDLIRQEEQASLTKNMVIIREIYTPEAIVTNAEINQSSLAYTFYSLKFSELDYCTASHGHFEAVEFSSTEVTLTTSSQGTWGRTGKGCTEIYSNDPGSDQWIFRKVDGHWKIDNFEFNRKLQGQP